jgi:hypothetical protein
MFEAYKNYVAENKRKLADKDPEYVKAYYIGTAMFALAFALAILCGFILLLKEFSLHGIAAGIGDFINTVDSHAFPRN